MLRRCHGGHGFVLKAAADEWLKEVIITRVSHKVQGECKVKETRNQDNQETTLGIKMRRRRFNVFTWNRDFHGLSMANSKNLGLATPLIRAYRSMGVWNVAVLINKFSD